MSLIKFLFILLLVNVAGWLLMDGILYIEFLLKPYTPFEKQVMYWFQHLALTTVLTIFTVTNLQD